MMKDVSVVLEVPVAPARARSGGIMGSPSYLRVGAGAGHASGFLEAMGDVITRIGSGQRHVYVQAINEFVSLDALATSPHDGVEILGEVRAARAERGSALAHILGHWEAEAHVILSILADESALEVLRRVDTHEVPWWRFSRQSIQHPFLELQAHSDPIGFFADSHTSFEFFGSEGKIWSLLEEVRKNS